MTKLFYDKLFSLKYKKLENYIKKVARIDEEKYELWRIIDEIIHHRILRCILDNLDTKHHEEFLVKLYEAPHDEALIDYLQRKIKRDVREFLRQETKSIFRELLTDIQGASSSKKKSKTFNT